ncbi:MAG: hypothetical protein ABSB88_16580 [Bryobacteraceae bacterium]
MDTFVPQVPSDIIKRLDLTTDQMIPFLQLDSLSAIAAAKKAIEEYGRFWLGNEKVEAEFYYLDILTERERLMAVDIALQEILPACRLGPQPPDDVSSHPPFKGRHLYAFCWHSEEFKKDLYFKFALVSGSGSTRLAVYSFHEAADKYKGDIKPR